MYSTLRWMNSLSFRGISKWLVCFLGLVFVFGISSVNVKADVWQGVLSTFVFQANEQDTKTVKTQTGYLLSLAKSEIKNGNTEKGKTLLQHVLVLDPQNKNAKEQLVELTKKGETLKVKSSQIAAGLELDKSLTPEQMINLAAAKIKDGDFAGASDLLNQALKQADSEDVKTAAQSMLRVINKEREQFEKNFQTKMNYNLSKFDAYIQKGLQYLEFNQYDKAEIEIQRALQIKPDDERAKQILNQIYDARGSVQQAKKEQKQAVEEQEKSGLEETADTLFEEGVQLYRQGQIIDAVDKWNQAVDVYPDHQASLTYLTNTKRQYEKAVEKKEKDVYLAAEERKYEEMLDEEIHQYSTQGERVDIKNVISTLFNLSKLNVVMGEHVEGNVAIEMKSTTLREILNILQKKYGIVWNREGNTVFIEAAYKSKIFPLTEEQYKTIELILNDPSSLEDSSRNLENILYGPSNEFKLPGKELYLNKNSRSLVVVDTEENIRKVEAFLKEMPEIVGDKKPVVTRTYALDRDIASQLYEIVKIALFQDQGSYDTRDIRRQLFLEPNSSTLIVIDYPENIDKVEDILANQQIGDQIEQGDLVARRFQIRDMDDVGLTPEEIARRSDHVDTVAKIIRQMLTGKEGVEKAALEGRIISTNPEDGSIDIVDTRDNIRKVEDYLSTIRGESSQEILIESFKVMHVDVYTISDALGYLFYDSQQSTRALYLSQNNFQAVGSSEDADAGQNVGSLYEETTRNRFNLTGGGGGGTDLLQFFQVRFFPDENTNSIVVFTMDQEVLDLVTRVINTYDQPQRMVEMENRVVSVSLTDLRTINFDYILTNPFLDKISLNPENLNMDFNMIDSANDTADPGFKFNLTTIGESRLQFAMNLLESTQSFNVLSAPKMLAIPNSLVPPIFFVGDQVPYADDVQFEDQGDDDPTNNRLVANFQRTSVGVSLAMIPFILNDDHIYFEVQTNITEAGERLPVGITGEAPPGQTVPNIGPLLLGQKFVQTSVRLRNGETLVLAGLIDEKETESLNKVPLLHKIPFLGNLFQDRSIEKTKTSTMIFITARIIEPDY